MESQLLPESVGVQISESLGLLYRAQEVSSPMANTTQGFMDREKSIKCQYQLRDLLQMQ